MYLDVVREYVKLNSSTYEVTLKDICLRHNIDFISTYNYIQNGLKKDSIELYNQYRKCSRSAYRGLNRERLLVILDKAGKVYEEGDSIVELLKGLGLSESETKYLQTLDIYFNSELYKSYKVYKDLQLNGKVLKVLNVMEIILGGKCMGEACAMEGISCGKFKYIYNKYVKGNRVYVDIVKLYEDKLNSIKTRNDKELYKKIIRECIESGESLSSLSDKYDISYANITKYISRDLKKHDIVLYRMYKSR